MNAEEWREVPGWPGYMASDQGRVRSHRIDPLGRLLAVAVNPQNHYPIVGPSRHGKQTMSEQVYPFYFAVPRSASRVSRERVPSHLAREFGVVGAIEHVRSEESFHLYRVVSA